MWTLILYSLVIVNKIECQLLLRSHHPQLEDSKNSKLQQFKQLEDSNLPAKKFAFSDYNKTVSISERPWTDVDSLGEYNYIIVVPRPSFLR